jgi:hypothetical protein
VHPFGPSKQIWRVLRWLGIAVHVMISAVVKLVSAVPHVKWWQFVISVAVSRGTRLLSCWQSERACRRMVKVLVKTAPARTVVVRKTGSGVTVWLEPGSSTQPGESA